MKQTDFKSIFEPEQTDELTLFSFGGGQDSWAILLKFIHDQEFRVRYAPKNLLVLMSDTGWEHPKTYLFTAKAMERCVEHQIEFVLITPDMGHHPKTWQTLTHNYELNNTIGSKAFSQTCTDNIKIKPQFSYLTGWLRARYNINANTTEHVFQWFYRKFGKMRWIIGFADGEDRQKDRSKEAKYRQEVIEYIFPLQDIKADRKGAQRIITSYGYELPPPSNCTICFWMNLPELLWLYRNLPEHYWYWVRLERNKLNKSRSEGQPEDKNHGPFPKTTIVTRTKLAIDKYGHWSTEQLEDYKMSHGHCVKSKY